LKIPKNPVCFVEVEGIAVGLSRDIEVGYYIDLEVEHCKELVEGKYFDFDTVVEVECRNFVVDTRRISKYVYVT
jgi:hypothetical protein